MAFIFGDDEETIELRQRLQAMQDYYTASTAANDDDSNNNNRSSRTYEYYGARDTAEQLYPNDLEKQLEHLISVLGPEPTPEQLEPVLNQRKSLAQRVHDETVAQATRIAVVHAPHVLDAILQFIPPVDAFNSGPPAQTQQQYILRLLEALKIDAVPTEEEANEAITMGRRITAYICKHKGPAAACYFSQTRSAHGLQCHEIRVRLLLDILKEQYDDAPEPDAGDETEQLLKQVDNFRKVFNEPSDIPHARQRALTLIDALDPARHNEIDRDFSDEAIDGLPNPGIYISQQLQKLRAEYDIGSEPFVAAEITFGLRAPPPRNPPLPTVTERALIIQRYRQIATEGDAGISEADLQSRHRNLIRSMRPIRHGGAMRSALAQMLVVQLASNDRRHSNDNHRDSLDALMSPSPHIFMYECETMDEAERAAAIVLRHRREAAERNQGKRKELAKQIGALLAVQPTLRAQFMDSDDFGPPLGAPLDCLVNEAAVLACDDRRLIELVDSMSAEVPLSNDPELLAAEVDAVIAARRKCVAILQKFAEPYVLKRFWLCDLDGAEQHTTLGRNRIHDFAAAFEDQYGAVTDGELPMLLQQAELARQSWQQQAEEAEEEFVDIEAIFAARRAAVDQQQQSCKTSSSSNNNNNNGAEKPARPSFGEQIFLARLQALRQAINQYQYHQPVSSDDVLNSLPHGYKSLRVGFARACLQRENPIRTASAPTLTLVRFDDTIDRFLPSLMSRREREDLLQFPPRRPPLPEAWQLVEEVVRARDAARRPMQHLERDQLLVSLLKNGPVVSLVSHQTLLEQCASWNTALEFGYHDVEDGVVDLKVEEGKLYDKKADLDKGTLARAAQRWYNLHPNIGTRILDVLRRYDLAEKYGNDYAFLLAAVNGAYVFGETPNSGMTDPDSLRKLEEEDVTDPIAVARIMFDLSTTIVGFTAHAEQFDDDLTQSEAEAVAMDFARAALSDHQRIALVTWFEEHAPQRMSEVDAALDGLDGIPGNLNAAVDKIAAGCDSEVRNALFKALSDCLDNVYEWSPSRVPADVDEDGQLIFVSDDVDDQDDDYNDEKLGRDDPERKPTKTECCVVA